MGTFTSKLECFGFGLLVFCWGGVFSIHLMSYCNYAPCKISLSSNLVYNYLWGRGGHSPSMLAYNLDGRVNISQGSVHISAIFNFISPLETVISTTVLSYSVVVLYYLQF